jgi:hypothetical protein
MRLKLIWLAILSTFLFQCGSNNYDPSEHLNAQQKDELMMTLVRYIAKAPENVKEKEKFRKEHDAYYQQRASQLKLEQYYKDHDVQYFLISQPAPSLTEKRHATGGKIRIGDEGAIVEYEEVFRTWKMVPDTLIKRSYLLFDKMVKGESLDNYLTKNSMPVEYIEFPDERTYFDKAERRWKNN